MHDGASPWRNKLGFWCECIQRIAYTRPNKKADEPLGVKMEQDLVLAEVGQLRWLRDAKVRDWTDWDSPVIAESPVHRIHSYPAKFPAHIPAQAISLARSEGRQVRRIGDIFCGCGTVAYEGRRHGLEFWGCDVNPVAALIARVKSGDYISSQIDGLATAVETYHEHCSEESNLSEKAVRSLVRWFGEGQFGRLARLRQAIERASDTGTPERDLLDCAFSASLKSASLWRSRSTKPSLDPRKIPASPLSSFLKQMALYASAWAQASDTSSASAVVAVASATDVSPPDQPLDLLVSSPPYVTSYQYADLHQLSLLWLGFVDDHRVLRAKMVGSASNRANFASDYKRLNDTASHLSFSMYGQDQRTAASVAQYYLDMQAAVKNSIRLLTDDGMAVFVVGNATLKGVLMDNARHLIEAMLDSGYRQVRVGRRAISNKKNTSYRSRDGRLTSDPSQLRVYAHEYILVGEK